MTNPFKPYALITESEKKIRLSISKTRRVILLLSSFSFFLLPITGMIVLASQIIEDPKLNNWLFTVILMEIIAGILVSFRKIIYETTISPEAVIVTFNRFFKTKTITTKISEIESFEKLEISHSHSFYIRLKNGSRLKILQFDMIEISEKQIPQIIKTLTEITNITVVNRSLFTPKS